MVRIAGVTIPNDKRIEVALTYVFGIGRSKSNDILESAKIDPSKRTKDLSDDEIKKIRDIIEKERIEGELRRDISMNIKRLKEVSSYRGSRHTKGLPVRGQRSKTNSRTVRGNVRKTMGSGRAKAAQKT